ncbi:hypothetical protein GOODEAATRI_028233 [Goodea atripinnis]|uniref:50S ribosomal protein L35 n=1 Tax=Goodea atripinnis TaxID=208336 RepID=A0ABV0NNV1_9TELE
MKCVSCVINTNLKAIKKLNNLIKGRNKKKKTVILCVSKKPVRRKLKTHLCINKQSGRKILTRPLRKGGHRHGKGMTGNKRKKNYKNAIKRKRDTQIINTLCLHYSYRSIIRIKKQQK